MKDSFGDAMCQIITLVLIVEMWLIWRKSTKVVVAGRFVMKGNGVVMPEFY